MSSEKTSKLGWFVAVVVIGYICTLVPSIPQAVYYGCIMLGLFVLMSIGGFSDGKADVFMLLLYFFSALSIVANDVPSFFKPWFRLGSFMITTLLVSPAISSETGTVFRIETFKSILILLEIVVCISFSGIFLGFGKGNFGFSGITQHSMQLGPLSSIIVVFSIYAIQKCLETNKFKYLYYGLLCVSLICMLQAASRAALLGCVVAVMVYLFVSSGKSIGALSKTNRNVLVVILLLSPILMNYTDGLEEKNNRNIQAGGITSSRDDLWQRRIDEWKSSPIIGIGYSSVATGDNWEFNTESGQTEPGSSWLSVLSSTGILGLLSLIGVFFTAFSSIWRISDECPEVSGFLLALISFFAVHMMAEGYIFSGGEVISINVWLLLGVMSGVGRNPDLLFYLDDCLTNVVFLNRKDIYDCI